MVQQERLTAEWERFREAHTTRKTFDFGWFLSLWHRSFPEDSYARITQETR